MTNKTAFDNESNCYCDIGIFGERNCPIHSKGDGECNCSIGIFGEKDCPVHNKKNKDIRDPYKILL